MYDSLGTRQKDYEVAYDYKLTKRVPVVVRVDGRGFSRLCRKLKKPYEPLLMEAMVEAMLFVVQEMAGAVFAYQQSDEITFVLRNDQSLEMQPWYGNRIQKIASIASSLTTLAFNRSLVKFNIELAGNAIFDARVFAIPTVGEVVNNLVWRQQDCNRNSISGAAETILGRKLGKEAAIGLLQGLSLDDRIKLMFSESGIDFIEEYPGSFRNGVGAYKIPMVIPNKDGTGVTRKKWRIDWDLPNFVQDRDFIYNIIQTGQDVFRSDCIPKEAEVI